MKLKYKIAHDWTEVMSSSLTPEQQHGFELGFIKGFDIAKDMAAEKIYRSVNLDGIENPDQEFINCRLQSYHDHGICMKLGEEEA